MFLGIKQCGGRVPLPLLYKMLLLGDFFYNPPVKAAPGFKGLFACLQHVSVQPRKKKKGLVGNHL